MNCPRCNRELQPGFIPNGEQPVHWIPEGGKVSLLRHRSSAEGVELRNRYAPFKANGYRAEAYYCPSCQMVIAFTGLVL